MRTQRQPVPSKKTTMPQNGRVPTAKLPRWYYAAMTRIDGDLVPDEVAGVPERLNEYASKKRPVRRFPFLPLNTLTRFAVAHAKWESYCLSADDERTLRESRVGEQADAIYRKQWKACQQVRLPMSLVDVLENTCGGDVEWHDPGDLVTTREEALEFVAQENARRIEGADDEEPVRGGGWSVVVELGEPVQSVLANISLDSTGVGCLRRYVDWPVRVVRPTSEELARFPIAAALIADRD